MLINTYKPVINFRTFRQMVQSPGQTKVEYVKILERQGIKCQFTTFWDEVFIDQLILGVINNLLRKMLLFIEDLTFDKAVNLVLQFGIAEKDSCHLTSQGDRFGTVARELQALSPLGKFKTGLGVKFLPD